MLQIHYQPIQHLPTQTKYYRHQNKVRNTPKVNTKDTRTTFVVFTVNPEATPHPVPAPPQVTLNV